MSSNLPTFRRLFSEDFREAPAWFTGKYIPAFNLYSDPIYQILSGGIDLMQNTREEIYSTTFTANGMTNGFNFAPKKFVGSPSGVIVAQCTPSTSVPTPNVGPVAVDWVATGTGMINILKTHNLTSGQTYHLTLRIF